MSESPVSPLSSELSSSSLSSKYTRLASEYSRLRAQSTVLKRAVLEEQKRSTDLAEDNRLKELALRKLEAETEALNFRNTQLTARVRSLQDEQQQHDLSNNNNNKFRLKFGSQSASRETSSELENLLSAELQAKIEENASLHKALVLAENKEQEELQEWQVRANAAESALEELKRKEKDEMERVTKLVQALKEENSRLKEENRCLVSQNALNNSQNTAEEVNAKDNYSTLVEGEGEEPECKDHLVRVEEEEDCVDELSDLRTAKSRLESVVASLEAALKTSEQKCEHWKLEAQLSDIKLKQSLNEESVGQLSELLSYQVDNEIDALVADKLLADGVAMTFKLECEALQKRARAATKKCRSLEHELSGYKRENMQLQENLVTTATNYEQQLSMMSEHVADLNEQLVESEQQKTNGKKRMGRK